MNFEEALAYMGGLLRFGWKLGNDRITALLERLGSPQDRYSIIHVAGTKGKGSTTALSAAILKEVGYHVGSYFSPYVYDPCERVQVDGEMIPRADFARLVTQICPHIEAIAQTELGQVTEFELKTALGFLYFAERKVDFACIEVGIGGRLDATNVVKPAVTVITNIGLDHTEILGETHALIAAEKAGIIKCGIPCITAADHPDALRVITETAESRQAPLTFVTRGDVSTPTHDPAQVRWDTAPTMPHPYTLHPTPSFTTAPQAQTLHPTPYTLHPILIEGAPVTIATADRLYIELEMRMGGIYQRGNAACAVAAVERMLADRSLPLPDEAVRRALATTALPGRLQIVRLSQDAESDLRGNSTLGPLVVLDGAHNEMAAQALSGPIRELRAEYQIERLLLVIGMVGGHDPEGFLAVFAPDADRIYACQPDWRRAQPAEKIAEAARRFTPQVEIVPAVRDAVRAALSEATPHDMILITGSFYTVGEVSPELLKGL